MYEVCLKSTGILIFINTKMNSHKDVFFKYFSPNDMTSSHIGVPAISKCFKSPLELFPSQGFEFCLVVCASFFSESWNLPPLITNFSLRKKNHAGLGRSIRRVWRDHWCFFISQNIHELIALNLLLAHNCYGVHREQKNSHVDRA